MSDVVEKNTTIENFQTLEEVKREHFFKAMQLANGNKAKAARLLGVTQKSMYNMADRYFNKSIDNIKKEAASSAEGE